LLFRKCCLSEQQLDLVYNQIKNTLGQCIVFCDLFVIHYATPYDRIQIRDMILDVYQHLFDDCFHIFNLLLDMATHFNLYEIQFQVLYIMNCICNGPRIANLNEQDKYHIANMHFKKLIVQHNILNKVYAILKQNMTPAQTLTQSISLIARFASFNKECRDKIYQMDGLLSDLLKTLQGILSRHKIGLLKIVSFALAILMGDLTHENEPTLPPITMDCVTLALTLLSQLLFSWRNQFDDADTLVFILHALVGLLPGIRQDDLYGKLVQLLEDPNESIVETTLSVVFSKVLNFNDSKDTKIIVYILVEKCKILERLKELLCKSNNDMIRYHAMLCITDIIKIYPGSIMHMDKLGIISDVIFELTKDFEFNDKIVRCLRHLCRRMPMGMLLSYLEKHDLIHSLIGYCIEHFKPVDDVLDKFYNVEGDPFHQNQHHQVYNFELIYHTMHCLLTIVANSVDENGMTISNGLTQNNVPLSYKSVDQILTYQTKCLLKFKMTDIMDIGSLLKAIVQSPLRESINKWKYSEQQNRSLEEYVRILLVYIKSICDKISNNVFIREISLSVQRLVEEILNQSYSQIEQQTNPMLETMKNMYAQQKDKVVQLTKIFGSIADSAATQDEMYYKTLTMSNKSLIDLANEERELKFKTFNQLLASCSGMNIQLSDDVLDKLLEYFTSICDKTTGTLSKEQFITGLMTILNIQDRLLIENNYDLFDMNKSGTIDFREFVVGIAMARELAMSNEAAREKLLFQLFSAYDLNKDNTINFEELLHLRKSVYEGMGLYYSELELIDTTRQVFAKIDTDNNGIIDFAEFCNAVKTGILDIGHKIH